MRTPTATVRSRLIGVLTLMVTLAVAIGAGVLTAVASRDMALRTGAVADPGLAWLVPLVIEGGGVVAGLLAWRRSALGQGSRPERCVLGCLIAIAVLVNAAHLASPASLLIVLGVVLAAAPPVVLVACVEMLLRSRTATETIAMREQARTQRAQRRPLATAADSTGAESVLPLPGATSEPRPVRAIRPAQATRDRAARVESMLARDPGVTGAQVGEVLGVSASQGRRLLAAARERAEQAA